MIQVRTRGRHLAVLSTLLLSACGGAERPASAPAGGGPAAPAAVDLVKVVSKPLDTRLTLAGELAPYQTVDVHARVSGFVRTVAVDRGTRVRQGQLIATLEAPELLAQRAEAQSKVQAAEAQLAAVQARADAERSTFEKLTAAAATPGVVAGNDVLVAQKGAEAARSQVAGAERSVDASRQALRAVEDMAAYLRITAPFDGVVSERNVHPGALVGPGGAPGGLPLFRLVDARTLRLTVPVPEAYAAGVTVGTEVGFGVRAYPGQTFTGRVARLAQTVDQKTRTMAVELDVPNGDERLAPGSFAQVEWPVRRRAQSLFVPPLSVATTTDRTFVIRVRDGKAEWVDVRTGLTAGPLVEVFGDVQAGDNVVGRATDELRAGTMVVPREQTPSS